jgi:glutathione S-transferase
VTAEGAGYGAIVPKVTLSYSSSRHGQRSFAVGIHTEVDRLLHVMDRRLTTVPFLGGEEYSIADISAYPGVIAATTYLSKPLQHTIAAIPNVHRWLDAIGMRPAVKRGMTVPTL